MIKNLPHFTRKQVCEIASLDSQTADYWSKMGIIQSTTAVSGKGQPRQFDQNEVTIAKIASFLSILGVGHNSIKEITDRFHDALRFFSEKNLVGFEQISANLIECYQEIRLNGFAAFSDFSLDPSKKHLVDRTPLVKSPLGLSGYDRLLNWEQVLEYYDYDPFEHADIIDICKNIDYLEWKSKINIYCSVHHSKFSNSEVQSFMITRSLDGEWIEFYNSIPQEYLFYTTILLRELKEHLWGKPRI